MILSFEHEFAFLKVPKTAGTSVELYLEPLAGEDAIVTAHHAARAEPRAAQLRQLGEERRPRAVVVALGSRRVAAQRADAAAQGAALLQPHAGAHRARPRRREAVGLAVPVLLRPQLVGQVDLALLLADASHGGAAAVRRLGARPRQPADRDAGVH